MLRSEFKLKIVFILVIILNTYMISKMINNNNNFRAMDYSTFVFPFRMNINDMKLPKLADPLMYFLSEDLMIKTLNVII